MEKEVRIQVPEGMEIDKENSTFECIKFKPIQKKRWRDNDNAVLCGYYINNDSEIIKLSRQWNVPNAYSVFATEKQAKSALAMARISQIMANDERFGGVVTDEEWKDEDMPKHTIRRIKDDLSVEYCFYTYYFLSFHTAEQRDLFLEENLDLVRDYLMID